VSTQSIDTQVHCGAGAAATRKLHAFFAAMLGIVILFGVAFASIDVVHNAAHDGRHSLAVPCH